MIANELFKRKQSIIRESCPDIAVSDQLKYEAECRRQINCFKSDIQTMITMYSQSEYISVRLLEPLRALLTTIDKYELPIINRDYVECNDPLVIHQANEERKAIMKIMDSTFRSINN